MKPRIPQETPAQAQQRIEAERENLRVTQESLQQKTRQYQRLRGPRISIATGRSLTGAPLG